MVKKQLCGNGKCVRSQTQGGKRVREDSLRGRTPEGMARKRSRALRRRKVDGLPWGGGQFPGAAGVCAHEAGSMPFPGAAGVCAHQAGPVAAVPWCPAKVVWEIQLVTARRAVRASLHRPARRPATVVFTGVCWKPQEAWVGRSQRNRFQTVQGVQRRWKVGENPEESWER